MRALTAAAVVIVASGCSKDEEKPTAASAAPSAPPAPTSAEPAASAAPAASASAESSGAPRADCPKGSAGEGTFAKPCEAKGKDRMMEVAWTGKTDDKGPFFRVTNKSPLVILYGKIAVYFYDKAGKQLEVTDTAATPPKKVPNRVCSGNMFGGVMKANEKAVLQFSCVKKEHVPEGTAAIEAEMQGVGFADATEKKVDLYWSNHDIVPDARKKGGVK
ncbi:MAG: hypothetical protein KF819_17850 [Labilithrix sp.]|nr:hypothetical protein [Labilithrix sp.]